MRLDQEVMLGNRLPDRELVKFQVRRALRSDLDDRSIAVECDKIRLSIAGFFGRNDRVQYVRPNE